MWRVWFIIFIFLNPWYSNVQGQRYFGLGTGGAYITARDEGMSVLNYSNYGTGFTFFLESQRGKALKRLLADAVYAKALNGKTNVGILHTLKMDLYYNLYLPICDFNKSKMYLGGSVGLTGGYRYQPFFLNSGHNYDVSIPLGISLLFNRDFMVGGKSLGFQYWFDIPLLSSVVRPAYASPLPDGLQNFDVELQDAYFRSAVLLFPDRYSRFRNQVSISVPVSSKNTLKAAYSWDFYRILHNNPYYFAGHNLSILYVFGLEGKKQ